ncbi:TPA: hypothetical protein ACH3X1_007035 [Trebouxia sp. C0004]
MFLVFEVHILVATQILQSLTLNSLRDQTGEAHQSTCRQFLVATEKHSRNKLCLAAVSIGVTKSHIIVDMLVLLLFFRNAGVLSKLPRELILSVTSLNSAAVGNPSCNTKCCCGRVSAQQPHVPAMEVVMSDKVMQSTVDMEPPMYASCLHTANLICKTQACLTDYK